MLLFSTQVFNHLNWTLIKLAVRLEKNLLKRKETFEVSLRKKKDPVDKSLFSSDEEEEGMDETLLTTKSIQTKSAEDQSQQEDAPSKRETVPVGLVGGGNKNKENKDGGLEDQTQTVKTV